MKTFFSRVVGITLISICFLATQGHAQCEGFVPITITQGETFVNPIPIPPLITEADYHLVVEHTEHIFDPNGTSALNVPVPAMAFNDINTHTGLTLLGPSISWQFREMINAKVTNNLDRVTTTHWHGAHVAAKWDGGPHQRIFPGETWHPTFEVLDKSATMWYHPHAMDLTYSQVQMGLSGMIYVEDPVGEDPILSAIHDAIPHTYGVDDFPLIIQTKQIVRDTITQEMRINEEFGYKKDFIHLVNGLVNPILTVPQNVVRFRLLNGDGKYTFNLGIGNKTGTEPMGFHFIATDAGYTDRSYYMTEVPMAPGERTEWLVDFRNHAVGDTVYLYNNSNSLDNGIIGGGTASGAWLAVVVGENTQVPVSTLFFPIGLHPSEAPSLNSVDRYRTKMFRYDVFDFDPPLKNCKNGARVYDSTKTVYNIDSVLMDMMVVNDTVRLGDTEVWTIVNDPAMNSFPHAHPWHIHDIHFWVTEIVIGDSVTIKWDDFIPEEFIHIFKGPKDNVLVEPGWKLSYITTFDDHGTQTAAPENSYMYHCHILPHEDRGMMGQFVVLDTVISVVNTKEIELAEQAMKVYPNPTDGLLYLEGHSDTESLVRILDIRGSVVREERIAPLEGAVALNLDSIPKGIVFVQWLTNEGRTTRKVILQ